MAACFSPAASTDGRARSADKLRQLSAAEKRRLVREDTRIDARLDLHGLPQDRAHHALSVFIRQQFHAGRRQLLVITGRGKSDPDRLGAERGVLRRVVPEWLSTGALGGLVSYIAPAHRAHGGAGAYYVRLRRTDRTGAG